MTFLVHALLLSAVVACQQADRTGGREQGGDVSAALPPHAPPVATTEEVVRQAQTELEAGHPWFATRRLAPVVSARARTPASPEAVLVAARAAAAWGGWAEVQRLLTTQPWLAARFAGDGLQLMARAALELDSASTARQYAEAAVAVESDAPSRAVRLVLLARALDRLNAFDSAAATYARAANALPPVRDWLVLRSAGASSNAGDRQRLYASVRDADARERVPYTEAQALERFGPADRAADAYAKLGDEPSSFRLRLTTTRDDAARAQLRVGLVRFIQRAGGDELRRAIDVLDAAFPTLDVAEQLAVSRRAAAMGVSARAVSGFAAVPVTSLGDADVIAWANALMSIGKSSDAARRLGAHTFAAENAPRAGFLRGRALLRAGSTAPARVALATVVTKYASSTSAADAQHQLAEMTSDVGNETAARELYRRSCAHEPAGAFSDDACFRAGIVSFALGDLTGAARTMDDALRRFPDSPERAAMLYWAGRAWQGAGNTALAKERWRVVMQSAPVSYYASASARRLGTVAWTPTARPLPESPRFAAALSRVATLEQLGMDAEARLQLEAVESAARETNANALAAGAALLDHDEAVRAVRLGRMVAGSSVTDSAPRGDSRAYMLVYPLPHRDEVLSLSRANKLDPALVAAVIRQESSWNPRAVSVAGARGLMQIMPAVGQQIARSRGYPLWDPALLFDPDVNLELGTAHLSASLNEETNRVRALAAYNAGSSRVARWSRKHGTNDAEVFIERIPFAETRDYVKVVLRNAEIYRALYGLQ